jgi:threonine aldolase
MSVKFVDLRSDTVTRPTPEMRRAMAEAEVGDDVYGEDPTVNRLEQLAAQLTSKEAGLFVPSGTMGNLLATISHCQRGQEVLLGDNSHIFYYEVGGAAIVGGLPFHILPNDKQGSLDLDQLEHAIRGQNIHYPTTGLFCLENTHNRAGGTVLDTPQLKAMADIAHSHNVPVHLDGARIFNAAVYLDCAVSELVAEMDSVQFCLSKGLCAPVGSLLVGQRDFIERARKNRKMLGGGMRQAGVLAAAGLLALTEMPKRLHEDHANARYFAEELLKIHGFQVELETVQTNIVCADVDKDQDWWAQTLAEAGVRINTFGNKRLRFVLHKDVNRADIDQALTVIAQIAAKA